MSAVDIALTAAIVLVIAGAVFLVFRRKRRGGCCSDCGSCGLCKMMSGEKHENK